MREMKRKLGIGFQRAKECSQAKEEEEEERRGGRLQGLQGV